jgi:hypothetical protein
VHERLGALDPTNPGYAGEEVRQEEIGGMVGSMMGTWPANGELEEVATPQRFAKLVKKAQAAKPGQARSLEGEMEFSGSFGHASEVYQNGGFVRNAFYRREAGIHRRDSGISRYSGYDSASEVAFLRIRHSALGLTIHMPKKGGQHGSN